MSYARGQLYLYLYVLFKSRKGFGEGWRTYLESLWIITVCWRCAHQEGEFYIILVLYTSIYLPSCWQTPNRSLKLCLYSSHTRVSELVIIFFTFLLGFEVHLFCTPIDCWKYNHTKRITLRMFVPSPLKIPNISTFIKVNTRVTGLNQTQV